MNVTLVKQALEKTHNSNALVKLISRCVCQLNAGLGSEIPAVEKAGPAPGRQGRLDY